MNKIRQLGLILALGAILILFIFILPAWANNQPIDGETAGTIGASITGSAVINQLIEKFKGQDNKQSQQTEEKTSPYSLIGLNNRIESTEVSNTKLNRKLRIIERYLRRKFPDDWDPKKTL